MMMIGHEGHRASSRAMVIGAALARDAAARSAMGRGQAASPSPGPARACKQRIIVLLTRTTEGRNIHASKSRAWTSHIFVGCEMSVLAQALGGQGRATFGLSREYWVMKRPLLQSTELNSIVCGMIVVAAILISAKEGKTHERILDRQAVVDLEQRSTSGRSQSTHPQSLLKFAQWKCPGGDVFGGPDCREGGGGGRGGGGGAIGLVEAVEALLTTKIAHGVSLALLVTLGAVGSRWLWNRISDWKPSLFTGIEEVDVVECSVFGPRAARPGDAIMIGIFLYLAQHRNRASFLAKAMDSSATLRARCSEIAIKRGATVEISCAVNTLCVDEPVQTVVWQGRLASCQFLVTVPEGTGGRSFFAVVRVSVDGSLIGRVKFRISSAPDAVGKNVGLGNFRRYEKPFVSYATKDRKEVLKRLQMLQIMKTNFFMDLLSLDPGDRWEKKLYKHIDRCDLFLLFWSKAAKDSLWVLREAEYALTRQQKHPDSEPDIVPVILEGDVSPPPSLAQLNFNDRIHYLISLMDRAEATER